MRWSSAVLFACVVSCGGASTPASTPAKEPPKAASEAPTTEAASPSSQAAVTEPESVELPTSCANDSKSPCVMPRAFVKRLCAGAHPELALYLFAKDSPWTRIYVSARQVEPFNGLGGPSSDKNLEFDEELLVLSENAPNLGGMTVSGVGNSYDVLRWDGTCATLQAGEVRTQRPPSPKHADIDWKHLDESVRDALSADEKIAELSKQRRKECKGVTMGVVSDKCEKADVALRSRVVKAIRDGFPVPRPSRLP